MGLTKVVGITEWMGNVFLAVLPYVGPLFLGIAAAIGTYLAITNAARLATLAMNAVTWAANAATKAWAMAQAAFNFIMNMNPILLIITLIVGLITALAAMIATLKPVRDFFAQAFRFMGDVVAGFVGFAIDGLQGFVNFFVDAINFFLDGVNQIINTVGKVFGMEGEINLQLQKVDFSGFKEDVKSGVKGAFNAAAEFTEDFTLDNIKKTFGLDKFEQMDSTAQTPEMLQAPNASILAQWDASSGGIPKVGEVGRINESVDISSEDLKMMRDLAEMQQIQNFVTLTPTVQVTTGDIRQEADVNVMIRAIEQSLEREIQQSAQGVFG